MTPTNASGARAEKYLDDRLAALALATEIGAGRLPDAQVASARAVLGRASERRALSSVHTSVGFFGATGSGKSTLFNAVSGQDIARGAATRPTTAQPLAAIWGEQGSGPLLDWLEVERRHVFTKPFDVPPARGLFATIGHALGRPFGGRHEAEREPGPGAEPESEPNGPEPRDSTTADTVRDLILLDLPDFDSVASEHRDIVRRLTGQVDLLVWVLDPQKYADAALHHDFLAPLATHRAVTLVVLNQIDLLRQEEIDPVVASLRDILAGEGLGRVSVLPTSARNGDGVADLRRRIGDIAAVRRASSQRLAADVGAASAALAEGTVAGELAPPGAPERTRLAEELALAARADAVAGNYRRRALGRTGWPLVRWIGRFRADPLRRLNLHRDTVAPGVNRTSLPKADAAQTARTDSAVRSYADGASTGAPEPWRAAIRARAREHSGDLPDALDQAIATTDLGARTTSWWWPLVSFGQWTGLLAALVGGLWLLGLFAGDYVRIALPEPPTYEGFPVPTLLLVCGILAGIVLGILAAACARLVARLRSRKARERLRDGIADVATRLIVAPVAAEIESYETFRAALRTASAAK